MSNKFWEGRRLGWVVGGLLVATAAMTVGLLRAKSGANTANVLALPVAIASLAVAARGLWPSPPLSRAARELANQVAQERGDARQQALGMSGDFRPADMAFRSPRAQDEPELVRWRSDGGPEHGTLGDVAGFYRALKRGRMVVLGEPGAGKTVLATQLVIDLIGQLPDGELRPGAQPPVPVWLSLTSLDLGETDSLGRASAEEIAARLDQWIAMQMSEVYQVSRPAAERLIRGQWVLPVLDGLDEMDTPSPDTSHPARPRAAAVVRALNRGTGRRPVVLVCRHEEYGQLARSDSAGAGDPVLQDANQIVLQPLDAPAIREYLTRRFPGEHQGSMESRWENVQAAVEAPTTPEQTASLAEILSSPWALFLATTAYQDSNSDPGQLILLPEDEVGEHLLGKLIPAVIRHTPPPASGHYSPDDVSAWLGTLAQHLDQTSKDPKLHWSSTDLRLELLWPIAGQKKVQWLSTLAGVALFSAAFAVPGLLWVHTNGRWYPDTGRTWTGLIAGIALIVFVSLFGAADRDPTLNRLDLHLTSPASRRKLADGLAFGLLAVGLVGGLGAGLGAALIAGRAAGERVGPAVGLAGGLALGLAVGLEGNFSLAAKPTSIRRQNITYGLSYGLALGLAIGLALGLALGLAFGLAVGLALAVAFGLTLGGLTVWIRYVIGCWLARRKGMLPRRVGQFLDWAYRASLLRMSGTAVQFRHRELQAWLGPHSQDRPTQPAPELEIRSQTTRELPS
jgi:hypothetical protein